MEVAGDLRAHFTSRWGLQCSCVDAKGLAPGQMHACVYQKLKRRRAIRPGPMQVLKSIAHHRAQICVGLLACPQPVHLAEDPCRPVLS